VLRLIDIIYNVFFGAVGTLCVVRLALYYGDPILAFLSTLIRQYLNPPLNVGAQSI
jgi:hypothetical protein